MAAYKAHIETAHFKKYKNLTKGMIKSLQLIETDPIVLGAKNKRLLRGFVRLNYADAGDSRFDRIFKLLPNRRGIYATDRHFAPEDASGDGWYAD